jgi:hypothetical protein
MKPPLIHAFLNADNPRERFPAGIDWGSIIQFHSGIMRAISTQTRIHVPPLRLDTPGQLYVDINTALPHVFAVCKNYGAQPSAQAVNKCIVALVEAVIIRMNLVSRYFTISATGTMEAILRKRSSWLDSS